jgi:hypothetical protein
LIKQCEQTIQGIVMRYILVMAFLITSLGTVFFFPLNINEKYTCFFHRIFNHTQPVSYDINRKNEHVHTKDIGQTEKINSRAGDKGFYSETDKEVIIASHGSVLLDNYLDQYAFAWWASIGFFALTVFRWLKLSKKIKKNKSGRTT